VRRNRGDHMRTTEVRQLDCEYPDGSRSAISRNPLTDCCNLTGKLMRWYGSGTLLTILGVGRRRPSDFSGCHASRVNANQHFPFPGFR
jgi:hypothetical protein